uniref:Uncharacterized protein AlNc14C2G312 n=1 Tax=Albugo laibachii Nc14 TaxID=890382 RepID=F0VZH4_9STRA|nr:conserved hypothetical protein [Albugo laibachii Nc14]|eukprot:CCA14204.1 conserved hypothetical protein [Albugo laibachii Nc14]
MELHADTRSTEPSAMTQDAAGSGLTVLRHKERIPASPLLPNCIHWSQDGRVAVVTDAHIMITTFRNREMEFYMQNPPILSKSFIFFPQDIQHERLPVEMTAHKQESFGSGCTSYWLLRKVRSQNPKEMSLSKNESNAFIGMEWGPRDSGPNAFCAIVALSAGSRISLHFASSYQMNWTQAEVLSDHLYTFLEEYHFDVSNFTRGHKVANKVLDNDSVTSGRTKRARSARTDVSPVNELMNKCALLATLTIAWSGPIYRVHTKQEATSYIVFAGKKLVTLWEYSFQEEDRGERNSGSRYLSTLPVGWLLSEKFGWVTASTWQQFHTRQQSSMVERMMLALGTSEGMILLVNFSLTKTSSMDQLVVDRIISTPGSQPVGCLHLGSRASSNSSGENNLVATAGPEMSVWNTKDESMTTWTAHDANITGLGLSYFGDVIMSASIDGCVKAWVRAETTYICKQILVENTPYPLYGLAVSPLSVQLALLHVMPPAARPNRKSQADMSYSRVACAVEIMRSPLANSASSLIDMIYRILEHSQDVASFTDVLWLCHQDNTPPTPNENSLELSLPALLHNVKGVDLSNFTNKRSTKPLYLSICEKLETQYFSIAQDHVTEETQMAPILLLQASYLLRASIEATKEDFDVQKEGRQKLLRSLYSFWAVQNLNALHKKLKSPSLSETEVTSALLMADFLSIQSSLRQESLDLVTSTYEGFGSHADISRWKSMSRSADAENESSLSMQVGVTLPVRERCIICQKDIIHREYDFTCESEHTQQRCFLSFRAIRSVNLWKCLGCGACADKVQSMQPETPFYLLNTEGIRCRLCGSHCILFRY